MAEPLNYDQLIPLDAEALAEAGIGAAYSSILPTLNPYLPSPMQVVESLDPTTGRYSVSAGSQTFLVNDPAGSPSDAWGRATYALFTIVNDQLPRTAPRLYALNGGHELGGLLLTLEQVAAARSQLPGRTDWPYIPTLETPWFGQPH